MKVLRAIGCLLGGMTLVLSLSACAREAEPASGSTAPEELAVRSSASTQEAPSATRGGVVSAAGGPAAGSATGPAAGSSAPNLRDRFPVEVEVAALYDADLHDADLPKGLGDERPGPRLLVKGRVRNLTAEPIHRGGLFAYLEACFGGVCVERPSHDRGFTLPLDGEAPWRPGTWRHFVVVTRPLDPVYRELVPSSVAARLDLHVEGPVSVNLSGAVWTGKPDWERFSGYPMRETVTTTAERRLLGRSVPAGSTVLVQGVAGLSAAMVVDGRRGWVPATELPELGAVLGRRLDPSALPATGHGAELAVEVTAIRSSSVPREADGEADLRFLEVDLTVTASPEARPTLSARDFDLLRSDLQVVSPENRPSVARPLDFGRLEGGERRAGTVAFPWPYGTTALSLHIGLEGGAPVNVVLARRE